MFRLRPLALWITAFAAGILCAVFTDGIISAVTFALLGVLCVLCVAVRRFPYRATLFPVFLSVLLGFSYLCVRDYAVDKIVSKSYGITTDAAGDVTETDSYGFTMSLVSSGKSSLPEGTAVYVLYDYNMDISAGDRVYGNFTFSEAGERVRADGAFVRATGDVSRTERGRGETLIIKLRNKVGGFIENNYSADTFGAAKAVLMGDRTDIDPMLYSAYRSSGISHLLVISGFHMSLVLMTVYTALSFTVPGKRYSGIICIFLALIFSAFVGFTPSVTRAAFMCIAVFTGGTLNYKNDSFTSLFTAVGILLVCNPYSLFSVGLLLSFLCTLGIIALSPPLQAAVNRIKKKPLRKLASIPSSVAISVAAVMFSFPVAAYVFGEFSVVSPVVNLFVIPLFNFAAGTGYISFIIPPLSGISDMLFRCINSIAVFGNSLGFSTLSTRIPGMGIALAVAAVSVIIICSVHIKRRVKTFGICFAVFASVILCSAGFNSFVSANRVSVNSFSSEGFNQAVVTSKDVCVYIDRGGYTDTDAVFEMGHTSIDVYIMLECDINGMGNFVSALSETGVEKLYISNDKRDKEIYERLLAVAERHGVITEVFEGNLTLSVGNASVTAGKVQLVEYKADTCYFDYGTGGVVYLDGKE